MNYVEQLSNSVYTSISQYHADLADPRYKNDPLFRGGVEDKLHRSAATGKLTGMQPVPTGRQSMSAQVRSDGTMTVGPNAELAADNNDRINRANSATKQAIDSFQKLRSVQVK
jgi:hypothetical protein